MHRFYISPEQMLGEEAVIVGQDVNHICHVLRMKLGEQVVLCDGQGMEFLCEITQLDNREVHVRNILKKPSEAELPVHLVLFQGIPKQDKMELIIQKTVELGIAEIVPVAMRRCVAKLDNPKKEEKKLERWQTIAEAAAKQSGRGILPIVKPPMTFTQALAYADTLDMLCVPYEDARGMLAAKAAFTKAACLSSAGILIGPEGGFEPSEIKQAKEHGAEILSLGKRILRTETAGLAALSMFMYEIECREQGVENGSIS